MDDTNPFPRNTVVTDVSYQCSRVHEYLHQPNNVLCALQISRVQFYQNDFLSVIRHLLIISWVESFKVLTAPHKYFVCFVK